MNHMHHLILENKIHYSESNGQIYIMINGYDIGFTISKNLIQDDAIIYNFYEFIKSEFEFFKQNIKIHRLYGEYLKIHKHEKGYFYIYAKINGHNITISFDLGKDNYPRNLQTSIGITIQFENNDCQSFEMTIGTTLPTDEITSLAAHYNELTSSCINKFSIKTY